MTEPIAPPPMHDAPPESQGPTPLYCADRHWLLMLRHGVAALFWSMLLTTLMIIGVFVAVFAYAPPTPDGRIDIERIPAWVGLMGLAIVVGAIAMVYGMALLSCREHGAPVDETAPHRLAIRFSVLGLVALVAAVVVLSSQEPIQDPTHAHIANGIGVALQGLFTFGFAGVLGAAARRIPDETLEDHSRSIPWALFGFNVAFAVITVLTAGANPENPALIVVGLILLALSIASIIYFVRYLLLLHRWATVLKWAAGDYAER